MKANENIPAKDEAVTNRRLSENRKSKKDKTKVKNDITVQWDNGNTEEYDLSSNCLRLFDNGPAGTLISQS